MLRNTPVILISPADHMINDASGTHTVFLIAGDVRSRKKCFHRMHIGI